MLSGEYIVVTNLMTPLYFRYVYPPDSTEQVYIRYAARGLYVAIKITLVG